MNEKPAVSINRSDPPQFPSTQPTDVRNISGLIQATTDEPTGPPRTFWQQFRIVSGAFWFYDTIANSWMVAGVSDFLGLSDTPDSYSGQNGNAVFVNSSGNGLTFIDKLHYYFSPDTLAVFAANLLIAAANYIPRGEYTAKIVVEPIVTGVNDRGTDIEIGFPNAGVTTQNVTAKRGGNVTMSAGVGGIAHLGGGSENYGDGGDYTVKAGDTPVPTILKRAGRLFLKGGANSSGTTGGGVYALAPDGTAGLSTSAPVGFFYLSSCAGTPTGTPDTAISNAIPFVYDRSNNKLYAYNGGAWKSVTLS